MATRRQTVMHRLSNEDLVNRILTMNTKQADLDEYRRYLFEYACQEAELLGLRRSCKSEAEYYHAVGNVSKIKLRLGLEELHSMLIEFRERYGGARMELSFDYSQIPILLRKKYAAGGRK